jgi:hypothetical protein
MTTVTPTTGILRRSVILAALCLATLQAFPAIAQQGPRRDGREMRQDPPPRPAPPPPDRQREVREREVQRRETMPPEERRQLRRDIYDHGRDIYRDRRAPR